MLLCHCSQKTGARRSRSGKHAAAAPETSLDHQGFSRDDLCGVTHRPAGGERISIPRGISRACAQAEKAAVAPKQRPDGRVPADPEPLLFRLGPRDAAAHRSLATRVATCVIPSHPAWRRAGALSVRCRTDALITLSSIADKVGAMAARRHFCKDCPDSSFGQAACRRRPEDEEINLKRGT